MATSFKTFLNNDITSTKTLLHEAIPITGSIVSGTYGTFPNGGNIKNYAHGMFQSVYDYPYLSSSANHIFDLTVGYSTGSNSVSASTNTQNAKKVNLYNQMAQVLQGHDQNGKILRFDQDGNITGGTKLDNVVFINFARLLQKDEIKKGSFTIKFGYGNTWENPFSGLTEILTIEDTNAENDYRVNSPAGEYGILSATLGYNADFTTAPACGLIFYQAGVAVLSGSIFMSGSAANPLGGVLSSSVSMSADSTVAGAYTDFAGMLTGSGISASCNEIRHRLYDLSFNNTTELNSTIHFCRINHNDFNYSANPTYLSSSKIVVKNNSLDAPVSYLTTVGLYSSDNELLAVAKLSEPLKKDPTNEMTLRVRLDY
tara:strand:+ start:1178 stop:2290 length:1113 start_codon:yes stop_codon:yes gene_type:complete